MLSSFQRNGPILLAMTHMQSLISVPYALAVVLTMKTNRLGSVLFNLTFICVGGLFFLVFVNAASLSVFAAWPSVSGNMAGLATVCFVMWFACSLISREAVKENV